MSAAEIARACGLTPTGVRNNLEDLIGTGILASLGTRARSLVRLRREHPLAQALRHLFAAETGRVESVRTELSQIVRKLESHPRAVWMQGPVATGTDKPGDPITVGVLDSSEDLEDTVETLRKKISSLEKHNDVTIEVRGYSKADLLTIRREERDEILRGISLAGPHLAAFMETSSKGTGRIGNRTHENIDARTLALAQRIAERIRKDPAAIGRARRRLASRIRTASAGEQKELREWDRLLLSGSPSRLSHLLTDPGPRATRLRQSLPFLDVLTREEREELLRISRPS